MHICNTGTKDASLVDIVSDSKKKKKEGRGNTVKENGSMDDMQLGSSSS